MPSDNKVTFTEDDSKNDQFWVKKGTFVVTDFSVTPGQDTTITKGFETSFDIKGGFHFGADRSGSAIPATWFNIVSQPASQNTFDHDAGKLNFGVQGTMTLWVYGSQYGSFDEPTELVFEDTFLAQGHSAGTNNWWLAIKGATNIGDNRIRVWDQSGRYSLEFKRGRNQPDQVHVYRYPLS